MPAFSVIAGGQDLTALHDGLQVSNADPGGFEALQLNPQALTGLNAGQPTQVRLGTELVWDGLVNEPGQRSRGPRLAFTLAALGRGARLRDRPYSTVYIDRDLSRWGPPGRKRAIDLESSWILATPTIEPDTTSNLPALKMRHAEQWGSGKQPICETLYDAGQGNLIKEFYVDETASAATSQADANWSHYLYISDDEQLTATENSGQLWGLLPSTRYLTAARARRFAAILFYYGATPAGGLGSDYNIRVRNPAVYGDHGLTKRGADPGGFYPGDIVGHALTRSGQGFDRVLADSSSYLIPHLVYYEAVTPEQVITDMAKLMGWHWGVWEPAGVLADRPQFLFQPPPTDATCSVMRGECDELDAPKVRLDQLYDTAIVGYTDAAGSIGRSTVTLANPLLDQAGLTGRTLQLNIGVGSSGTATAFGNFALALSQRSARSGGSAILPDTVQLTAGGRKPSCLLRAGRDRLRITDLPDAGPLTETDTRRYDTFHVSRVETTIDQFGVPKTRVEFDGGADLMEVLAARLAIATKVAGG